MMANTLQSYALALLKSMEAQLLGSATPAHLGNRDICLQPACEESPSPEAMAQEFMAEIITVKSLGDTPIFLHNGLAMLNITVCISRRTGRRSFGQSG
jgi:hypothetical protein